MSDSVKPPSDDEIDAELMCVICGYDPNEKYPEWGNESMRKAYLAGWEDGQHVWSFNRSR